MSYLCTYIDISGQCYIPEKNHCDSFGQDDMINTYDEETYCMSNNLDKMIRRSGMTNRAVADEKGIKPETLSRHKSGAIKITRRDAEEYAQILNCLPQQIMYQNSPIPLLGHAVQDGNNWRIEREQNSIWYSKQETMRCLFLNTFFQTHTVCLRWQDDIEGVYAWMSGAYFIFRLKKDHTNKSPVNFAIDQEAIMHHALVRETGTGRLLIGELYPQPGAKKYTIYNGDGVWQTETDIAIDWAAPFTSAVFRPDLRGAEIVDVKKDDLRQYGAGAGSDWRNRPKGYNFS
jgi:DNA-binding Xre family transcriptional regulator